MSGWAGGWRAGGRLAGGRLAGRAKQGQLGLGGVFILAAATMDVLADAGGLARVAYGFGLSLRGPGGHPKLLTGWLAGGVCRGFYDRKRLFWKDVEDTLLCAACAPPGGGRQEVTPRWVAGAGVGWWWVRLGAGGARGIAACLNPKPLG